MNVTKRMSAELGISHGDLNKLAKTAPHRYKVFSIPKRSGRGMRTIAQPAKELKPIQRWLVDIELSKLPIHECATAYIVGGGIKKNALEHVNNNFLLKMDFSNFFPSILPSDLKHHVNKYLPDVYTDAEVRFISRLLFWQKSYDIDELNLCIGAPSSPFISNTILFDFDEKIANFCKEFAVKYTRYADDLAFSTNEPDILKNICNAIPQIVNELQYPRLKINHEKSVFTSKKRNRNLTGVTLSSQNQLSVGRERKRLLRAMINRFRNGDLSVDDCMKLRGLLAFVKDIEPSFIKSMEEKYSINVIRSIFRYCPPDKNN